MAMIMATKNKASGTVTKEESPKVKKSSFDVRVKEGQTGYYGHVRRKEGAEFTLANQDDFSSVWMERVNTKKEDD